jgi:hypothetical protein
LLIAALGTSWVTDFRYVNLRAYRGRPWSLTVARIEHHCLQHWRKPVHFTFDAVPCSRLVGISKPK